MWFHLFKKKKKKKKEEEERKNWKSKQSKTLNCVPTITFFLGGGRGGVVQWWRVNAGNKNTPSTLHSRRQNVTTSMVGLENGPVRKKSHPKWCVYVGCLTSQQQASVSQGRICSDKFTCCHTELEVADPTFYLTLWQYTDTGPTSPSADPITPGAWQDSHWSANFWVTGMTRPRKNPVGSRRGGPKMVNSQK